MQIRVSETVDMHGRIYLPYLTEWQYPAYDTIGLLQVCLDFTLNTCFVF